MKQTTAILTLGFMILMVFATFYFSMPQYPNSSETNPVTFSVERALGHVAEISKTPHGVGFPGHKTVREYLLAELEKLGLETQQQTGYTAGDWGNLSKAINILARVPGKRHDKALMLLSHYDSSPHSSLGAGDAGSGVAVILEGIRTFLAQNRTPENDLIILFTDAEELGLNGADLFVKQHPWAKEVGLVLNFEARGSGGPGYMLIETNGGNSKLIEAFDRANTPYPVANSLAYSIYKMLPNDTDLTVFREDGNISGFNFAFIDDHFDYHTAMDSYDRLDKNTLAHQASYLMPLLTYFADANLNDLTGPADDVYFNLPLMGLLHYPNSWIWPSFMLLIGLFVFAFGAGIKRKELTLKGTLTGFAPVILCLVINGVIGYFFWPVLKSAYPGYTDILHGFTYNGYLYIAAISAIALANCFLVYSVWPKLKLTDALVAPALIWILLCGALSYYLPGAAFFVIPGFGLLASLLIRIYDPKASIWILTFLGIPAIWIFAPFVKMFPVGLGLKLLISSALLTTFIFLLLASVLLTYSKRRLLGLLGWISGLLLLLGAHLQSDFTAERPKPSSLVYLWDANSKAAHWATYDNVLTPWNKGFFESTENTQHADSKLNLSSKYGTGFSQLHYAPNINLKEPEISIQKDTVIGNKRQVSISIQSERIINRLEVFTNDINLLKANVNQIELSDFYLENRRGGKLITHFVSDNEPTVLELVYPENQILELKIIEASNDLLKNSTLGVLPRPETEIPMPFVLNDAVAILKTLKIE